MQSMVYHSVIGLIFLTFISCSDSSENPVTTHTVTRGSFISDLVLEGTVVAVNSSMVVCPQQLNGTIIYLVEDGTKVKKGDRICLIENREYSNHYDFLRDKVEQSKAQYNKGLADLEMNHALLLAQVKSNEAQTAILFLDSAQLSYLTEQQRRIKELELKIASLERQKLENKLRFLEHINESEMKKLELRVEQDENQVKHVKSILDKMMLTAPRDGLALRSGSLQTNAKIQEGDPVWEGMPLIEIPDLGEVKITILTSETHYKRVNENDRVIFTFDALPGNMGWGKIQKKSSSGQPINRNSKVRQFEITASVDSFITIPDIGVSAQCRVLLSHLPDTLVVPQLAVFDEDTMKVVYVKKKKTGYEKRQVVVGSSSPQTAVIVTGLKENEILSFVKPKESDIRMIKLLPDSILKAYSGIRNGKKETENDQPALKNRKKKQ